MAANVVHTKKTTTFAFSSYMIQYIFTLNVYVVQICWSNFYTLAPWTNLKQSPLNIMNAGRKIIFQRKEVIFVFIVLRIRVYRIHGIRIRSLFQPLFDKDLPKMDTATDTKSDKWRRNWSIWGEWIFLNGDLQSLRVKKVSACMVSPIVWT